MVDAHVAHANMVVANKHGGLSWFTCERELLVGVGFFRYRSTHYT